MKAWCHAYSKQVTRQKPDLSTLSRDDVHKAGDRHRRQSTYAQNLWTTAKDTAKTSDFLCNTRPSFLARTSKFLEVIGAVAGDRVVML